MLCYNEEESYNAVRVTIKKPTLRYLDEFISLRCSLDLLGLKLFPNAKEITESMAAFNAVRRNISYKAQINYDGSNISLFDIGCGQMPRTAALFAMRTKWKCYAIDPKLLTYTDAIPFFPINNLYHGQCKFEEMLFPEESRNNIFIFTLVHAHIDLEEIIKFIHKYRPPYAYIINIPCCEFSHDEIIKKNHSLLPLIAEYEDFGIHSPMRHIYVYEYSRESI